MRGGYTDVEVLIVSSPLGRGAVLLRPAGDGAARAAWVPKSLIEDSPSGLFEADTKTLGIATWKLAQLRKDAAWPSE